MSGETDETGFTFDLVSGPQPTLSISPVTGKSGDLLTVGGFNFAPRSPVIISLDDANILTTRAREDGSFRAAFPFPTAAPGNYFITARDLQGNWDFSIFKNNHLPALDDRTPPGAGIITSGLDRAGNQVIQVIVQDKQSGLELIDVAAAENGTVNVPSFQVGTTDPVVITVVRSDPSLPTKVELELRDRNGNSIRIDRLFPKAKRPPNAG
jgi:hypothetical protein